MLHFGLSEAVQKPSDARMPFDRLQLIQTEYSIMAGDPERNGVLKTCEELGIGFVP